ncbi:MAG: cohesin domain-containing protein [Nitrososphaerota archaeon]
MRKNILSFALVLTLLIGMFAMLPIASAGNPGAPADGASMWIEPDTLSWTTATAPAKFKVYIWCEIKTDTYTWQMYLTYNKAQLNALSAGYWDGVTEHAPGAGKSKWAGPYPTSPVTFSKGSHDATRDYILLGESLSGAVRQETPGVYQLAWVEFEIVGRPAKYETLTSELRLDLVGVYKSFFLEADYLDEVPMAFGKATYTLVWTMPPKPDVTVDPVETRFKKEPPSSVGKTFDIKVQIKNLDPAWGLHNATFDLFYNPTLIGVVDYAFDPLWAGPNVFDNATAGKIHVKVKNPTATPSGTVNTVTITFVVLYQGTYPAVDESPLDLQNVHLFDTLAEIEIRTITDGKVVIEGLLTLPLPYLEVESVTMGPEPVLGQEFNVTVSIKNLHYAWYLIGVQFRLSFDPSLIEFVTVTEGPFMPYWASQQNGSLGTFWYGEYWPDSVYGPHVLVGNMIYPNETGRWSTNGTLYPQGEGVIAVITFRVIYQPYSLGQNSSLIKIIEQLWIGLDDPVKQNIIEIAPDAPVDAVYTIRWNMFTGRVIDVYGGAVNRDYGTQHGTSYNGIGVIWPAPYGGQGPRGNMDLVVPQSEVFLFANVTYNHWPVQQKDVAFVIEGPFDQETGEPRPAYHVRMYAGRTDENGVAWVKFQMPWPCENPEGYFGKYKVTATVDICGVVVNDTMLFDYYYLVEIVKVTTNKYEYKHCEEVEITIEFKSKAQQTYPVLFGIVIQDDLQTHFGWAQIKAEVGGAKFCAWKKFTVRTSIHIPKWAFAGIATIYVSAFDKDPRQGGAAWCPTFGLGWPPETTPPKILINAYK